MNYSRTTTPLQLGSALQRGITQLRQTIDPLLGKIWTTGVFVRDIVAVSGQAQLIAHGLGRPWTGYVVVRSQGAAISVFDSPSGSSAAAFLQLTPSANGTFDLYVF